MAYFALNLVAFGLVNLNEKISREIHRVGARVRQINLLDHLLRNKSGKLGDGMTALE